MNYQAFRFYLDRKGQEPIEQTGLSRSDAHELFSNATSNMRGRITHRAVPTPTGRLREVPDTGAVFENESVFASWGPDHTAQPHTS